MHQFEIAAEHIINEIKKYVDERLATIPAGPQGEAGKEGPAGADGKSVTPEEVKALFDEALKGFPIPQDGKDGQSVDEDALVKKLTDQLTESFTAKFQAKVDEMFKALPMPKDGKDGVDGKDGAAGADGKSVDIEEIQHIIKSEIMGLPAAKDGKDGLDGKDAAQIEILDFIDTAKSYGRGVFALHQSGLWRSFEKTKGMRGWECIVNGLHELSIEQLDERNFQVKSVYSNDEAKVVGFTIPAPVYRGVFRQGDKYAKGDLVTWAGNIYHCNADTEAKPGEGIAEWTLSVKRGRDGRDKL